MRPAVGHEDVPFPFPSAQSACTALSVCGVSPVVQYAGSIQDARTLNCEPLRCRRTRCRCRCCTRPTSIVPTASDARKNDGLTGSMSAEYGPVRTMSRAVADLVVRTQGPQ